MGEQTSWVIEPGVFPATYGRFTNAIREAGHCVVEWNDEWWKANENIPHTWSVHDEAGHWQNTSYTFDAYGADKMNMNEEWWGVVSLDPKNKTENGLNARAPKQSYETLKSLWAKK